MTKKFVMLDLETMSIDSNAAIVAIGAVRYTTNDNMLGQFYRVVSLESSVEAGLDMDACTVGWWLRQSEEAREIFTGRNSVSIEQALKDFSSWVLDTDEIWGNGVDFDNVILTKAYKKCNMNVPFSYRANRCYRTLKNLFPQIELEREGTYHNALDDAISQAKHLAMILRAMNKIC